jgi:hypothetical protein
LSYRQEFLARRINLRRINAPIAIDGLWSIDAHGLFGTITPVPAKLNAEDHE